VIFTSYTVKLLSSIAWGTMINHYNTQAFLGALKPGGISLSGGVCCIVCSFFAKILNMRRNHVLASIWCYIYLRGLNIFSTALWPMDLLLTGYFSGNLILAVLAVVLVTLKIINANKTFTISINYNFPESEPGIAKNASC
jgi:hypothetical protein